MSETPLHYIGDGTTTCADAIASMMFGVRGRDMLATEAYWWGCAFKYIWRWPYKNGAEDVEKAIDCLQKLLDEERGCAVSIDAKLKAEPRDSIQCTECAHCRQDGVTLFCDCFDDMRCSMAHGTEVCKVHAKKEEKK